MNLRNVAMTCKYFRILCRGSVGKYNYINAKNVDTDFYYLLFLEIKET